MTVVAAPPPPAPAAAPAAAGSAAEALVPLPQLLGLESYNPNSLLGTFLPRAVLERRGEPTHPALEDWIEIFRHSIGSFRRTAEADGSLPEAQRAVAAARFADAYLAMVNDEEQRELKEASSGGKDLRPTLGCLELCRMREQALIAAGFSDIFSDIKRTENEGALALLPGVCAELDQHTEMRDRWDAVIRGVFAGNIFDLGCAYTTDMYHSEGVSFHATRAKLLPRPWVIDDMDALLDRLCSHTYTRAVLFVDNSGADVLLGMLPFARELLRRGTEVIIAANSAPSINDITAAELEALLPQICAADPVLCKGVSTRRLQVVASGSGLPVIDLSQISPELADLAAVADLIVLEGMGRSIETNLHVRLSCDQLNVGMVKHPEVAAALGGRMLDCVCQLRCAAAAAVGGR
ncbi:pantothenate kinase-like [Micractinium conductrix]|uniref:Pantothenate kinase-like n=1 Tax=Micractinium conductrix TaxID=554055 RepID=A0A2P6VBL4_9CHLO|nr:pantothenate kinase-like [Micractinium conductrix]|eukprot:PSC71487.1 pantothenate kinase-like [Micractinium conductrix]